MKRQNKVQVITSRSYPWGFVIMCMGLAFTVLALVFAAIASIVLGISFTDAMFYKYSARYNNGPAITVFFGLIMTFVGAIWQILFIIKKKR